MNLANCDIKREKYREAGEHCRIVATEDPQNAKAFFRWAKTKVGQGEYEAAIEKLETAQRLEPENAAVRAELTRVRAEMSQHDAKLDALFAKMLGKKKAGSKPAAKPSP